MGEDTEIASECQAGSEVSSLNHSNARLWKWTSSSFVPPGREERGKEKPWGYVGKTKEPSWSQSSGSAIFQLFGLFLWKCPKYEKRSPNRHHMGQREAMAPCPACIPNHRMTRNKRCWYRLATVFWVVCFIAVGNPKKLYCLHAQKNGGFLCCWPTPLYLIPAPQVLVRTSPVSKILPTSNDVLGFT